MKTVVAVVVSSALAWGLTYTFVPRRPPERIPPSWFELPGVPRSVDGVAVHSWHEANQILRERANASHADAVMENRLGTHWTELEGREVRITYAPRAAGPFDGPAPVETVVVRTFLPRILEYSRAYAPQLARFELVRTNVVE